MSSSSLSLKFDYISSTVHAHHDIKSVVDLYPRHSVRAIYWNDKQPVNRDSVTTPGLRAHARLARLSRDNTRPCDTIAGAGASTGASSQADDVADGPPDPFRHGLDLAVPEMVVAQRHADVGIAEQAGDDGDGNAVHRRVAGMRMVEIVKPDVLDHVLLADPVPEPETRSAGPRRIARRGKHVSTLPSRLAFQYPSGRPVEGHLPRPGLAVGQHEGVASDLGPTQPQDCGLAAAGEQEKPDDVGLRPAAPGMMLVEKGGGTCG